MIYRGINSPSVGEGCGNGLCIKHRLQSVISSDLLELQMMNFVNIPDHFFTGSLFLVPTVYIDDSRQRRMELSEEQVRRKKV